MSQAPKWKDDSRHVGLRNLRWKGKEASDDGSDWRSGTGRLGNTTSSAADSNEMGKDAFLQLLTAQIAYQNPLDPLDDKEFMAQLAQFTAVEQAMETNSMLEAIAMQQIGLANTQVASLVGREVTIEGSVVTIETQGIGTQAHYTLDEPSASTTVVIRDEAGNEIRRMDVGAQPEGAVSTTWDGRDDTGTLQPAGRYTVSVEAKGENGEPISVTQETTGTLVSVSFEGGYPTLHLDNGATASASDILRVGEGRERGHFFGWFIERRERRVGPVAALTGGKHVDSESNVCGSFWTWSRRASTGRGLATTWRT